MSDLYMAVHVNNIYGIINYVVVDLFILLMRPAVVRPAGERVYPCSAFCNMEIFPVCVYFIYCYFAVHGQYAV